MSRPQPASRLPDGVDLDLLDSVPGPLGLAVSGGGDSTALAVLLAEARPERAFTLLTVDHRLRAGSAADVAAVEALGARLGRPVVQLAARTRPEGSLQDWARRERYRLMGMAARARGLSAIVTAHTMDDQAETLLLRLARGSGLKGLAGIRARTHRDGLTLLRPVLGVTRGALREALLTRGVHWREDPSNEDPRFDRTAVRNTMPRLASLGLTADRLAATAAHLARASAAIDHAVDTLLARAATVDGAGAIGLALPAWADAPREVRLRALSTLVQRAGGMDYPPRFEPLAAAEEAILTGPGRTTLGRAVVDFDAHRILLWREARGITPLALAPGENGVFDGRWRIHLSADAPAVVVDALGEDAARRLPTDAFRPAVATAPGVFHEGALVAAPTLGLRSPGWRRDLVTMSRMR